MFGNFKTTAQEFSINFCV